MITKKDKDNRIVSLSACIYKLIKIDNNYCKLIIGKSFDRYIFIRLIINNINYENLFSFKNEDYNDIYEQLSKKNNPSYRFNMGKRIIYLTYSLKNIYITNFKLNMKSFGEKQKINSVF